VSFLYLEGKQQGVFKLGAVENPNQKKKKLRAYQFWVGIVVVDVVARRERDDPYPAGALSLKATRHQLMENSDYY